ncbi:MAG: archaeosortase/exosortase family protein [Verrucomicrobiota bacterium]
MPLLWLWFVLINHLRIEWTYNAQYSYGWAVPFLCVLLFWRRFHLPAPNSGFSPPPSDSSSPLRSGRGTQGEVSKPHSAPTLGSPLPPQVSGLEVVLRQLPTAHCPLPTAIFYLLLALCALLYAPTRLIQEANPDWRLVSWALALEVIGITLCILPIALSCLRSQILDVRPPPSAIFHLPSSPADPVPPSAPSSPLRSGRGTQGEVSKPHSVPTTCSGLRFQLSAFSFQLSPFAFPLLFFLVSVPWPTVFEGPLIQLLTRMDVSAACDLAGCLGIPAIPHGNVIELVSGVVGIDEACSGIRSFQATLMISLFLGEFYRISLIRRLFLCLAGFALAILLNLARQTVLIWVAAHKGVPAIAKWHDPTGVVILLGCFFALWGVGVWLARKKPEARSQKPEVSIQPPASDSSLTSDLRPPSSVPGSGGASVPANRGHLPAPRSPLPAQASGLSVVPSHLPTANCQPPTPLSPLQFPPSGLRFQVSAFALLAWLLFIEIGVEGWYRFHEMHLPAAVQWQVKWPTDNLTFKERDIAPNSRRILRFDDGRNAAWQADGFSWQAIFLQWNPGSVAARLTANHTPEVCLTATGHRITGQSGLQTLIARGLQLPFYFYQLGDTAQPVFVCYCLWEDQSRRREFSTAYLNWGSRFAPVLAGQRNSGQRSIEIVIAGVSDFAAAQTAVQKLLEQIIIPQAP